MGFKYKKCCQKIKFISFIAVFLVLLQQKKEYFTLPVYVIVGDKADCLKKGPRPIGGMPSVGVFLRDPSPYLREFRRKPQKTLNG